MKSPVARGVAILISLSCCLLGSGCSNRWAQGKQVALVAKAPPVSPMLTNEVSQMPPPNAPVAPRVSSPIIITNVWNDQSFLSKVAETGAAAFRLGQIAVRRLPHSPAEDLGRRLVIDWSQINYEVSDLADKRGLPLETGIIESDQRALRELENLGVADVTGAVKQATERITTRCLKLSTAGSRQSGDATIREFARRLSAMLRQHLTEAREVSASAESATPEL